MHPILKDIENVKIGNNWVDLKFGFHVNHIIQAVFSSMRESKAI